MTPLLIIVGIFIVLTVAGVAWQLYNKRKYGVFLPASPPPLIILVTGEFRSAMSYMNIKGLPKAHYARDNVALHAYRGPGVELHFVGPLRDIDLAMMRYANSRDIKVVTIPEPNHELRPIEKGADTWD
jgi:hypothetical protein